MSAPSYVGATAPPAYNDRNLGGQTKEPNLVKLIIGAASIFAGLGKRSPWNVVLIVVGGALIWTELSTKRRRPPEEENLPPIWTHVAAFAAGLLAGGQSTSPRSSDSQWRLSRQQPPAYFPGAGAPVGGHHAAFPERLRPQQTTAAWEDGWTLDSTPPQQQPLHPGQLRRRTESYDSGDEGSGL